MLALHCTVDFLEGEGWIDVREQCLVEVHEVNGVRLEQSAEAMLNRTEREDITPGRSDHAPNTTVDYVDANIA
jgi:hypothetical protein